MTQRARNVLFLCTGNSARSIMAEAILNRDGNNLFHAFSAGSQPRGTINPQAILLLRQLDYDTSALRSKSWSEFARPGAPVMDFIFTVCDSAASEPCPIWPGQPASAHWGIPDPAAVVGAPMHIARAFSDAYHFLHRRIMLFVALPLPSLDAISLQARLRAIGQFPARDGDEAGG